MLLIYF